MTPEDAIVLAGEALHGPEHWRMRLSRDLCIDDDTLRRWLRRRGNLAWDHRVFDDLLTLLDKRAKAASEIATSIRMAMEAARD